MLSLLKRRTMGLVREDGSPVNPLSADERRSVALDQAEYDFSKIQKPKTAENKIHKPQWEDMLAVRIANGRFAAVSNLDGVSGAFQRAVFLSKSMVSQQAESSQRFSITSDLIQNHTLSFQSVLPNVPDRQAIQTPQDSASFPSASSDRSIHSTDSSHSVGLHFRTESTSSHDSQASQASQAPEVPRDILPPAVLIGKVEARNVAQKIGCKNKTSIVALLFELVSDYTVWCSLSYRSVG